MANYEDLKRAFIKKYGEPVVCNEHLSDNAAGREYASLIDDDSKIETIWQLEKGAIILCVTGYKADPLQLSGCVEILHIDLKNRSLANEEELSDL